ncbi:MAG: sugar transferase [Lachnospiraceae bacterium]|nr:sugar transferase [Lachnospiraceae bacterium]
MKNQKTLGNDNLIQNDEEVISEYLKKNNLNMVNKNSVKVNPKNTIYTRYIKRFLDLLISIPAFILFLPLNCIIGICTFFDVGRPIFYKQTRVGKNGKNFVIIKFRNMNEKKDSNGKLLPPSERVTKFGKFIRKLSLDELLNFYSVIKGDMSIIGPRPLPVTFVSRMSGRHRKRDSVRPGLECPRIIYENPNISQYQNQFENDIWYVENVSLITDIRMIVLLIKMTINFKKRNKAAGGASYFVGYDENGNATSVTQFLKDHPSFFETNKE